MKKYRFDPVISKVYHQKKTPMSKERFTKEVIFDTISHMFDKKTSSSEVPICGNVTLIFPGEDPDKMEVVSNTFASSSAEGMEVLKFALEGQIKVIEGRDLKVGDGEKMGSAKKFLSELGDAFAGYKRDEK